MTKEWQVVKLPAIHIILTFPIIQRIPVFLIFRNKSCLHIYLCLVICAHLGVNIKLHKMHSNQHAIFSFFTEVHVFISIKKIACRNNCFDVRT